MILLIEMIFIKNLLMRNKKMRKVHIEIIYLAKGESGFLSVGVV